MEDVLLQYGALGVLALVCLISVRVLFERLSKNTEKALEEVRRIYDNEKDRADRLEEQLRQLNETMRTDYVNVLQRASQAMADANRAVGDALAVVRRGS
jgi:hypothetical protein